jgi:molybdenum cofactor synthesis domain-containing protein
MKPLGTLVPLETAVEIIDKVIHPVERTETLPIDDALGRVLAADVTATHSTPPFDRATMDGYAVVAADTTSASQETPIALKIIEEVFAGSVPKKRLSNGEAIQIATGARIPEGSDTVVMVEDTRRNGNLVTIFKYATAGSNITLKGSDIKEGEIILKTGTVLDPAKIGVLTSQGLPEVEVYVKPTVVIMPTGEEIVPVGHRLKEGQIYDINSHALASVIRQNGGVPLVLPITGDDMRNLKTSLEKALAYDMVVTSGGSSVGEKDFLSEMLASMGEVKFHGVKLKPGKPTAFAIIKGKPVLGMPGYPTSCLINAYLLLAPAVRKMARLPAGNKAEVAAKLGESIKGAAGRVMFLPVRLEGNEVYSVFKDSGAITSVAKADGYVVVPQDTELPEGASVSVTLF